jgi:hypothetical protein
MADSIHPSLVDHAKNILKGAGIPDEHKASLWDAYHDSADATLLARKLETIALPGDLRERLIEAKRIATTPDEFRSVEAALSKLKEIPAATLDLCEKHPTVLNALTSAARRET